MVTDKRIKIKIDGWTYFQQTGTFSPGKVGFYNFSQPDVEYGEVQITPVIE